MQPRRTTLLAALAAVAVASPVYAQTIKRGTWEGQAQTQNGAQPLTVVIDSGAKGWSGAAVSPQLGDSIRLVDVGVAADTLSFGIPFNGTVVYISGLIAADKFSGGIWIQNASAGTVELTRKKPAGEKPPGTPEFLPADTRRPLKK